MKRVKIIFGHVELPHEVLWKGKVVLTRIFTGNGRGACLVQRPESLARLLNETPG